MNISREIYNTYTTIQRVFFDELYDKMQGHKAVRLADVISVRKALKALHNSDS